MWDGLFLCLFDHLCQRQLGLDPDKAVDLLAIFEQDDGGNGDDAVFGGEIRFVVNIDFSDNRFAGQLIRQAINDRAEHFARSAPRRPEIDKDRTAALKDL